MVAVAAAAVLAAIRRRRTGTVRGVCRAQILRGCH